MPVMGAATLFGAEQAWHDLKTFVEHSIGFNHDALHVLAGAIVQLLAAFLLRTSLRDVRPLLAVLALELLNEWHDLRVETWPDMGMQLGEGAKDILLTMSLPLLLLILARKCPGLLVGTSDARDEPDASEDGEAVPCIGDSASSEE